jgi:hypothetical protein
MDYIERIFKMLNDYQGVFAMFISLVLIWIMQAGQKSINEKMIDTTINTRTELCGALDKTAEVIDKGLERNTRAILLLLSEKGVALMRKLGNEKEGIDDATIE